MYLTQHGEIEGTPTKAGFWYVVIMVTPEAGADYANTKEFEITIDEKEEYTLEIMQLPTKLTYTAGEKLDMTGLWVRIYTPDGFIDSRDGKDLTYSQRELVTLGEQKIKLTYKDAFEIFIVTVKAAQTTEPTDPDTTTKPTEPDTTTKPTDPDEGSKPTNPTDGTESPNPTTDTTGKNEEQKPQGMPWWGILLTSLTAAGAGVGVTILVQKKKK